MREDLSNVEFFTQQYRIVGGLRLGGQRLSDILNEALTSSVELEGVVVSRLLTPGEVAASYRSALLDKGQILFAISGMPTATETERRLYKHVDTVEWETFITVPSFELRGNFHVRGTSDLKTMLLGWTGQFIPLTEARAVFTLIPKVAFSGDVIIVNRAHIEVICTDRPVGRPPQLTG
jgi:hypothetical protein